MEGIKKKLAALKVERDDALERAEDADRLRKEAESKFDQCEQDVASCTNKMKLLENDLDQAEERASENSAKLNDAEARVEELERENRTLKKDIDRLEGEQGEEVVEDLKGKLKDLEALNEELTQSNKTLHRQVDNLEADLETAEDKFEQAKKELETTLAELGDL